MAEGDAQPLKKKKKSKSKADVMLDTVLIIKLLVSHCGRNTEWYNDKEPNWRKKLSDL